MVIRYAISGFAAFFVTFGLFYVMQALVAMGSGEMKEAEQGRVIDFVRVKREPVVKEKERELPNRPQSLDQPEAPDLNLSNDTGGTSVDATPIAIAAPKAQASLKGGALGPKLDSIAVRDRKKAPLMRMKPEYPLRAKQDRIEGYVVVNFDIDPKGQVKNAHVVAAKPRGVFEQAALRAIRKWKYRPTVEEGKAIWERGQAVKIPFRLTD
ncbi:MAG: TonB family protein [Myxococcales bacterium]|jgi:protein TonB